MIFLKIYRSNVIGYYKIYTKHVQHMCKVMSGSFQLERSKPSAHFLLSDQKRLDLIKNK